MRVRRWLEAVAFRNEWPYYIILFIIIIISINSSRHQRCTAYPTAYDIHCSTDVAVQRGLGLVDDPPTQRRRHLEHALSQRRLAAPPSTTPHLPQRHQQQLQQRGQLVVQRAGRRCGGAAGRGPGGQGGGACHLKPLVVVPQLRSRHQGRGQGRHTRVGVRGEDEGEGEG